jgi:hypothetical protein
VSKGNGHRDPNVASLEDARRRAAEKAKAAKRAGNPSAWSGPPSGPTSPRTARDWLIGGVIIALAVGLIASWVLSVAPATLPVGGGGL